MAAYVAYGIGRANDTPIVWFSYQRDKFTYSPATHSFARLAYPVDSVPAPTLGSFQSANGLKTTAQVSVAQTSYGKNSFDIPIPTFKELFAEHAVAPFFVFQLFCVGLWCLDEYWYYSLFTLFMLVVFECTVVFQVGFLLRLPVYLPNDGYTEAKNAIRVPNDEHQAILDQRLPSRVLV